MESSGLTSFGRGIEGFSSHSARTGSSRRTSLDFSGPNERKERSSRLGTTKERLGDGRYELQEFVSKGGMGVVYRARDVELNRLVAVKFLLDVGREDAKALALTEARTLAALNHPNIMKIYDVVTSAEQVWIVSEWLEGQCLGTQPTPLMPTIVAAIMAQIYDALAAAHQAKVIHRDIKPSNVMINQDGRVTLIDFGVAFAPGVSTGQTMVGSLRYTDPRILEGVPPDEASDLFAAAVMQFQLMTGQMLIPDMAPLPLYRYLRKNLSQRTQRLARTCYPPLADLARGFVLRDGGPSRVTASEAAASLRKLLQRLTQSTPEEYLRRTFCSGVLIDHRAEVLLIKEVNQAIVRRDLPPKVKAAWLDYYAALDDATGNRLHDVFDDPRPKRRSRLTTMRIAAVGLAALLATILIVKHERFTNEALEPAFSEFDLPVEIEAMGPPTLDGESTLSAETSASATSPIDQDVPQPDPKKKIASKPRDQKPDESSAKKEPAKKESSRTEAVKNDVVKNDVEKSAPSSMELVLQDPLALPTLRPLEQGRPNVATSLPEQQDKRPIESLIKNEPPPAFSGEVNNDLVNEIDAEQGKHQQTVASYFVANVPADLYLDGEHLGRLPRAEPLHLKPGLYSVKLENPYTEPFEKKIEVLVDQPLRYRFTLKPLKTKRTFVLREPAQLFINGENHGVVTEKEVQVPFGELDVWIKRDDEIKHPSIAISPGGPEKVSLE